MVISLTLLFYCWPPKQPYLYAKQAASGGTSSQALLQSSKAAATFLSSNGQLDASKLEVKGSTGDKILESSGKSTTRLTGQALIDTVQLDGVTGGIDDLSGSAFSKESLKLGQCAKGVCNNASVSASDFVFAVATHQYNEPTLIAGRAGRLVSHTLLLWLSSQYFVKLHLKGSLDTVLAFVAERCSTCDAELMCLMTRLYKYYERLVHSCFACANAGLMFVGHVGY